MDELIARNDTFDSGYSRPTRARITRSRGGPLIAVQHVRYVCVVDPEDLPEPGVGGLVLCPCGSAGWTT